MHRLVIAAALACALLLQCTSAAPSETPQVADTDFIPTNMPVGTSDHINVTMNGTHNTTDHEDDHHDENLRYYVVEVNFERLAGPYGIAIWILFASLAKVGFHMYDAISKVCPESCLLIILGVITGVILFFGFPQGNDFTLNADTFFYYLLPPIILEAGYFMPNRAFFGNIGTILLFAVVGTLWNTFAIGFSLFGASAGGWLAVPEYPDAIPLLHCLVFSSLISAVDPVAVLAVFEEIHVNEVLHIVVFGESLLNDAVTVVLYHMFERYAQIGENNINYLDILAGATSFLLTGVVGTLIGVAYGLLAGFITKYTSHVRVIEPIFVFLLAYLAYMTAEIFHFSGIMALTFCGIVMKRYVESNVSEKSKTTIKYFMKMLSSVSETIIFMFLGTSTVVDNHEFNWKLILFTLACCMVYRAVGVLVLSYFANKKRLVKLSMVDQFVMAYGGLRGAIAFCLAILIDADHISSKGLFVTTTIIVVFFTVFLNGISIKPLVNALRVKKKEHTEVTMNEQIHERMIDHLMAGVEDITGFHGNHFLRDKFEHFDNEYLKRYLLKKHVQQKERGIFRVHTKLAIKEAIDGLSRSTSSAMATTEPSLLRLIRNYSATSFHGSAADKLGSGGAGGELDTNGEDTVIDLQALNVHYSKKLADDTKIHHILTDNMIQTRRRWSRPVKHDIPEAIDMTPYHHTERTHLRQMIGRQQRKSLKRQLAREKKEEARAQQRLLSANGDLPDGACANGVHMRKNVSFANECDADPVTSKVTGGPHVNLAIDDGLQRSAIREEADDAAEGITFSAASPFFLGDDPDDDYEAPQPTAVEMQLPWKRYTGGPASTLNPDGTPEEFHDDPPPRLCEEPSWCKNPDYTPDLANDSNFNSPRSERSGSGSSRAGTGKEAARRPPWSQGSLAEELPPELPPPEYNSSVAAGEEAVVVRGLSQRRGSKDEYEDTKL